MSGGSKAWTWRHAFSQADLAPTTKHLLHTLGMFMNELGEGCYPSVADLVRYSGLDKKTVMKHLAAAREKGWISVSQHGYRGQRWKRQEYAACWPDRELTAACLPTRETDDKPGEGGGAVPPACQTKVVELVPEGGGTEGPKVVEQLHQDKTSPVTTPVTSPVERERSRAETGGEGEGDQSAGDTGKPDNATVPGRAAFEQRVMRFCKGEGYHGGEWPKYAGSSFSHIAKEFAKLDEEDRKAAERWRDAFLAKAKAQGVKAPMAVANYFRDRAWRLLTETEMSRAMAAKDRGPVAGVASGAGVAEVSRPEGWATGFGPVWAAVLIETLLAGPDRPHPNPDNKLWFAGLIRTNWPALSALHSGRGFVAPKRLHGLKELMEFVPEGSPVWGAWAAEARTRGWPDWPRKDGMDGLYFPKGGPDGLAAFTQALARHNTSSEAAE